MHNLVQAFSILASNICILNQNVLFLIFLLLSCCGMGLFEALPTEMLEKIFSQLNEVHMRSAAQVNKRFREICSMDSLWWATFTFLYLISLFVSCLKERFVRQYIWDALSLCTLCIWDPNTPSNNGMLLADSISTSIVLEVVSNQSITISTAWLHPC